MDTAVSMTRGGGPVRGFVWWTLLLFGALSGWMVEGAVPVPLAEVPAARTETNGTAAGGADANATAAIAARLAEARAQLAVAEALDRPGAVLPPGVRSEEVAIRRGLLQRLVRVYEQQLGTTEELAASRRRRADLEREVQAWRGFSEPRPYSVLLTDGLREEIQAERLKISRTEEGLGTVDRLIEEMRSTLMGAEESIRKANEQLERAVDPLLAGRLSWKRDLERLRSQAAAAGASLMDGQRLVQLERLKESRTRLGWLERQAVMAHSGDSFTSADLDKVVARLDGERRRTEEQLGEAQARRAAAQRALEEAEAGASPVAGRREPLAAARAEADLALRQVELETSDVMVGALRLRLEAGNVERMMWEMRFASHGTRSAAALRESRQSLGSLRARLGLWKTFYRQQMDMAASLLSLHEAKLEGLAVDSPLLPPAREQLRSLRERDELLLAVFRHIERVERVAERWNEGLDEASGRLPFLARVRSVLGGTGTLVQDLWAFELFTAEDTITVDGQRVTGRRSVTVGKVLMAVLILVGGIWVTGLVARIVEPVIVRRFRIERNQAVLMRRWLRAGMIVCLVVFSLVSVKIPLTAFAFAGGALAIGVGFGTQTLLKNFISGLILLFERPFRVGDVLNVAGQTGTVTSIGLRASVLHLWDGTETLIPNSSLLESNVTNWTYTNRRVRFSVVVGVAYGSDPRRVIQLLSEVGGRHGLVEKEPPPQVLFTDFGDSALMFELRFWVDVMKANAPQVASDLRQMVAGALTENGIVIAFPQRDLHLDTVRPLQIQMVPGGAGGQS